MLMLKGLLAFFVGIAVVLGTNGEPDSKASDTQKESEIFKDFVKRKICKDVKRERYENFYTIVKLRNCNWLDMVNYRKQAEVLNNNMKPSSSSIIDKIKASGDLELYDIEFSTDRTIGSAPEYRTLSANLFAGMNVRRLKVSGLSIERIDEDMFKDPSYAKYTQTLDLSNNLLKRIDPHTIANLKRLEVLNLSGNKLTFGERNFESNTLLTKIDLSNNDVQFLSPNVFDGLHRLESINLENNHLTKIDACTFSETQLSPISAKYSPLKINLQGNPIDCDCNVFYLNRHLNQQLNLTCSKPDYYKSKKFDDLKREDPAKRCDYEAIHNKCHPHAALSERDTNFLIFFGSLVAFLILVALCCCCNSINQSSKLVRMQKELNKAKKSTTAPKKVYADSTNYNQVANSDKEKLLANN